MHLSVAIRGLRAPKLGYSCSQSGSVDSRAAGRQSRRSRGHGHPCQSCLDSLLPLGSRSEDPEYVRGGATSHTPVPVIHTRFLVPS